MIEEWQIYLNYHQRMRILLLKKRDQRSFATKQRMTGVFAIYEILCYRGSPFPASHTLCHPAMVHSEQLIYPLSSLVAELGGVLSLFLGFSFMTLWDILYPRNYLKIVKRVFSCYKK